MKREKLKFSHYFTLFLTVLIVLKLWDTYSAALFSELDRNRFQGKFENIFTVSLIARVFLETLPGEDEILEFYF